MRLGSQLQDGVVYRGVVFQHVIGFPVYGRAENGFIQRAHLGFGDCGVAPVVRSAVFREIDQRYYLTVEASYRPEDAHAVALGHTLGNSKVSVSKCRNLCIILTVLLDNNS